MRKGDASNQRCSGTTPVTDALIHQFKLTAAAGVRSGVLAVMLCD